MADVVKDKLSAPPSPLPSSKSPQPPADSDVSPQVEPNTDMDADPDVVTKVTIVSNIIYQIYLYILHSKNNNWFH